MKFEIVSFLFLSLIVQSLLAEEATKKPKKGLQIGIKKKIDNCQRTSKKGDSLTM
jgi:hypothetical protein